MKNGVIGLLIVAGLTAAGMTAGCEKSAGNTNPPAQGRKITCTVGMITDIVKRIAGDKAVVKGIIGDGVDPHLYQVTRSDVIDLMDAEVVFYNGLMLEGKMTDTLIKVAKKRTVEAVTESIDRSLLLSPAEFAGHYDPHVWMDPALWKRCSVHVAETLGTWDAANGDHFRANQAVLAAEMDALHVYAKKIIATIPARSRILITAHDAFNYFSRAFGLEVHGIQGISTDSEAGIADINRLVDLIVEREVKAVFVESSVSDKNVKALIEGAASKGHTVVIGGTLFSDAMGKPGTYEGTYIGMIDHNATTIARALGGEAPQTGMSGKLTGVK